VTEIQKDYSDLVPGLTPIDVRPDNSGCDVIWDKDFASSTVNKLSTVRGLIYTFTQKLEEKPARLDSQEHADRWAKRSKS
jgi:hypothetical protein